MFEWLFGEKPVYYIPNHWSIPTVNKEIEVDAHRFTDKENEVMDHLCKAVTIWTSLDRPHPSDEAEFVFHIHALQNLLCYRLARRCEPPLHQGIPEPDYKEKGNV